MSGQNEMPGGGSRRGGRSRKHHPTLNPIVADDRRVWATRTSIDMIGPDAVVVSSGPKEIDGRCSSARNIDYFWW